MLRSATGQAERSLRRGLSWYRRYQARPGLFRRAGPGRATLGRMTTALVTGANKGIGYETARLLGDRGMTVLVGARSAELGEAATARLSSKSALNMVTALYAEELWDTPIKVNAANPGYCATDLNGNSGFRDPVQGADVSVHLATLPDDGPTGVLWGDQTFSHGSSADGGLPW
jgi:NAD(P)-dependent dehydrogenase (short-subunit alcohol dehydrogenase family)